MLPTSQLRNALEQALFGRFKVSRGRNRKAVRRGIAVTLTIAVSMVSFSGCSTLSNGFKAISANGAWNETVVTLRNKSQSQKAWLRRKHMYKGQPNIEDFRKGFRDAYEELADGGDGCMPQFPPSEYWGWQYQSASGKSRTAAWFSGYPHGVRAAEEDGVAYMSEVNVSFGQPKAQPMPGMEQPLYPIPSDMGTPGAFEPPMSYEPSVVPYSESTGGQLTTPAAPAVEVPLTSPFGPDSGSNAVPQLPTPLNLTP